MNEELMSRIIVNALVKDARRKNFKAGVLVGGGLATIFWAWWVSTFMNKEDYSN